MTSAATVRIRASRFATFDHEEAIGRACPPQSRHRGRGNSAPASSRPALQFALVEIREERDAGQDLARRTRYGKLEPLWLSRQSVRVVDSVHGALCYRIRDGAGLATPCPTPSG
jgi:hypothetical protein